MWTTAFPAVPVMVFAVMAIAAADASLGACRRCRWELNLGAVARVLYRSRGRTYHSVGRGRRGVLRRRLALERNSRRGVDGQQSGLARGEFGPDFPILYGNGHPRLEFGNQIA